jgi:hypothetical protein
VFLGPSLPSREARRILAADYRPPARRGDIYRIIPSGIKTIVLIDGYFHSTPSIWPREILDAMAEGIQVLGASSMGALRAAELHEFGMIGYGTIFDWYRRGLIDGDDEVALWHGPEETDFCPLSEPLVNMRATLRRAVEDGCITNVEEQELLDYAKQTYYPERSYAHLLTSVLVKSWPEQDRNDLQQYILTTSINLKQLDAVGVLRYCAEQQRDKNPILACDDLRSNQRNWQLDRIVLTGFCASNKVVPGERVLREAEKDSALLSRMWKILSTRAFLLDWARHNKILLSEELLRSAIERWGKNRDIAPGSSWLQANGLTAHSCRSLLAEQFLFYWLLMQGPRHFGITCRSGTTAPARLPRKETNCWGEPMSFAELELADNDMLLKLSSGFLVEWARQNGVSCPPDVLSDFVAQRGRGSTASEPGCQADCAELDRSNDLAEIALTEWMVARGPAYFGLDWSFEYALLRELQTSGMAARLLASDRAE